MLSVHADASVVTHNVNSLTPLLGCLKTQVLSHTLHISGKLLRSQYSMLDVLGDGILSLHFFPVRRTVHEPVKIRLVDEEGMIITQVNQLNEQT